MQLSAVQFHLINTTILFLSREGFRRGCLRAQQEQAGSLRVVLRIAALSVPFGLAVTLAVCAVSLRGAPSLSSPYAAAVALQGKQQSPLSAVFGPAQHASVACDTLRKLKFALP